MIRDISLKIAGKAGDGALFTGNMLARILKRNGWEVSTYRDFPSNIRGEATNYTVRASWERIYGRGDAVDVLLGFDCEAVGRHLEEVKEGGIILCDEEDALKLSPFEKGEKTFHPFPLRKLAHERFGNEIFKNMIALGALCHILALDFSWIEEMMKKFLKREEEVTKNIMALKLGCEEAERRIGEEERFPLERRKDQGRLLISGNEAIALGALAGGCRFFAAYPICPASEIWQFLAIYFPEFNGLVIQAEDELAALNMALGASYAGVRAMTSTSGPGASLMMEGYSLSGMAEIPIVIAAVQRVGPSTGIPTKTEQGDLNQWVYGGHGDFPRLILSPSTLEECFELTYRAFNLAEKYQCPVIILTEQDYAQNLRTVPEFDFSEVKIERGKLLSEEDLLSGEYKRYEMSKDGISPRVVPSLKRGIHMVESNEHDEKGYRNEDPQNRTMMVEKRMRKLDSVHKDLIPPRFEGEREAEMGLIGFGSTFGPLEEARIRLEKKGIKTRHMHLRTLWPFPSKETEDFLKGCKKVFVVENNYQGQLSSLISSQIRNKFQWRKILKYSGQAFTPGEVYSEIEKVLG